MLSIGCENEAYLDLLSEILSVCRKRIPAFHPFLRLISHRSLLNLFYQGEIELMFGFRDDVPLRSDIVYQELSPGSALLCTAGVSSLYLKILSQ